MEEVAGGESGVGALREYKLLLIVDYFFFHLADRRNEMLYFPDWMLKKNWHLAFSCVYLCVHVWVQE